MIQLGLQAPARVERRDSDYSQQVVNLLLNQATGNAAARADATAALEAAAGAYGRAFASAEVTPVNARTLALTPSVLQLLGRQLVRAGEAVLLIDVRGGQVRLLPAGEWEVTGGADDRQWLYRVDLHGPSSSVSHRTTSAGVVHARYAVQPNRPWRGMGPLEFASLTGGLSASLELSLANETAGSSGYLVSVPDDGESDTIDKMRSRVANLKGRTAFVEAPQSWSDTPQTAPRSDYKPMRIGADPPDTLRALRSEVGRAVLGCAGVPVELFEPGQGTGQREAWRRFLFGTVAPVANIILEELRAKLEVPDLAFGFQELRASDLAGRARGFAQMVQGGMDPAKAAGLAGLMEIES